MSKLSRLYLGQDEKGNTTNEIPWPGENQSFQRVLNAGVEQTIAVPDWAYSLIMVVPNVVSCGYGDTPLTLATDAEWQSQLSEINPISRPAFDPNGNRITTLRFISYVDGAPVNVIFYTRNQAGNI